jgi:hypothetical protein
MTILKGALQPLETDKLFDDSPDTGHKDCICSRCAAQIQNNEHAMRVWTTNNSDRVDENSQEYRYCELCMTGKKYFNCETFLEMGFKCDEQCEHCKKLPDDFFDN